MKTNEAPEKIYITPYFQRRWFTKEIDDDSVEYTRTDVFIEKAYEWFEKNWSCYINTYPSSLAFDAFKNYMKGE